MRTRDMVHETYEVNVEIAIALGRARERGEPAELIAALERMLDVAARLVEHYTLQRGAGG